MICKYLIIDFDYLLQLRFFACGYLPYFYTRKTETIRNTPLKNAIKFPPFKRNEVLCANHLKEQDLFLYQSNGVEKM